MISYNIPMAKLPILLVISFLQLSTLFLSVEKVAAADVQANIPPSGWNSYDSYSWIISEEQFLQNARVAAGTLLQHGYEYVVVDYLWYRKLEDGSSQSSPGFDNIDEWGRLIPDPNRWPSSQGGKGFKEVADIVHNISLKFGIHVMAGISTQAVNANTPIMGSNGAPYEENGKTWYAKDIGLTNQTCSWMPACFMSVQTNLGAGRAFLKSLYTQYAEWGVDFVKHDCVFGADLNVEEIKTVSQILQELDHPIVYSLSPGKDATPQMAMQINSFVNMYRITNDDWDNWGDVEFHFNVSRDFAKSNLIGANGLRGKSWPDSDMLPIGYLTDPGVKEGPHRFSNLSLDEQKTQLTLWGITKSPLMFGGDLITLRDDIVALITNPTLLNMNINSNNNQEVLVINTDEQQAYPGSNSIKSFKNETKMASKLILRVSSCKENTKNWRFDFNKEKSNQLCWKGQFGRDNDASHPCFYHVSNIDQNNIKMKYQEEYQILASSTKKLCLDSSPNQLFSSEKVQSHYFSPCREHASQKWRLRADGSLYNDYTHLCARLAQVKDATGANEVRVWGANGPEGENYFGLFNLTPRSTTVSIKLKELMNTTTGSNCTLTEIWSGDSLEDHQGVTTLTIQSHGVAFISQKCH